MLIVIALVETWTSTIKVHPLLRLAFISKFPDEVQSRGIISLLEQFRNNAIPDGSFLFSLYYFMVIIF